MNGRVFVPGDDGYDTARQTWNVTTFDQRPAIVAMPSISTDVVSAVNFSREHNLSIAVQGGGHGHPHPANDALLVNFASMTNVQVMPVSAPSNSSGRSGAAGTARAEAGAKWRDVIAAAHPHGLAPLNGFAGTVGVSGYTLGGGIGWLVRQYGAAAGSLRSAELVTADGRLLQVNDQNHADLFWGLRGGGGNFGIVTSFEFDLYPVKEIFGGFVVYPLAQGKQALSAYAQWTKTVPDTLTSAVRLVHYPPAPVIPEPLRGVSAIVIMACYNGSTAEGAELVKPLRSIGTPLLDTFRPMPYAQIATIASDPRYRRRTRTPARGGDAVWLPIAVVYFRACRRAHAAIAGGRETIGHRSARSAEGRTDRRGADQQPRLRQHQPVPYACRVFRRELSKAGRAQGQVRSGQRLPLQSQHLTFERCGHWPTVAPVGYVNNLVSHRVEPDPERAPIIVKLFEWYASGEYSLTVLTKKAYGVIRRKPRQIGIEFRSTSAR